MKSFILITALVVPVAAADWKEDRQTVNRSFKVATGLNVAKLEVDNLNGFIHVTGGSGSEIQVKVDQRFRGETQADLDRAKSEIKLGVEEKSNFVRLFYDTPEHNGNWGDHHYGATFEYEIQVPDGIQLDLHTLNAPIEVHKTKGDFKVHTLNGKVDMDQVGGSGDAHTLNGAVKVTFAQNPPHPSNFHTLNGPIDIYFPSAPDADLTFHTLHGGVYSDFDVTLQPVTVKGGSNRFIYRSGGEQKVRSGKGGPELDFHTLNGAIRLHSKAI